jgi:hypothetical protein
LLEQHDFEGRTELLTQVDGIEYVDGPVTMMRLRVNPELPPAKGVQSPIANGPTVVDRNGETVGMLLLWLDDDGYIDCLEYAWVTDDAPMQLPDPQSLVPWVR